ncbi:MAG: T9SS type A sorting domain-containing protein [Flavobacteriaceae bacterium]
MKKIYILAFAILAFAFTGNAQTEVDDNFDSYNLGDMSSQAFYWRTWSGAEGGTEDADVVNTFAFSGSQSLNVDGSGVTDMIMLVESFPSSGKYSIEWKMYIPAGKEGYFNMQADLTPLNTPWAQALMGGNVYFNCGGLTPGQGMATGVTDCSLNNGEAIFTFPHDEWFTVTAIYDLDVETWGMLINGVQQFTDYTFVFNDQIFAGLAGIDFFSASSSNEFYIDDLILFNGDITLSSESFEATGFAAAMSNGQLTLKANENIDSVEIFNMLGQKVYSANVASLNTTINMSSYANGTYIIKASVNGNLGTVKVIK